VTYGYSKDKRSDLKQFVLSTQYVDRAVPMWGMPEDGHTSDKTLNTTLLSEIAYLLAQHRVQPGAYIYIADAAHARDVCKGNGCLLTLARFADLLLTVHTVVVNLV
jgi:transposase